MGQFFTGMVSGWTRCAKLAGIKAATVTNVAPCNSVELRLENVERWHSEFIAAVSLRSGWMEKESSRPQHKGIKWQP